MESNETIYLNYTDNMLVPIGPVANLFNIHQRSLRIYDQEGLLSPDRNIKNRRMYNFKEIQKIKLILFLTRNLAINLSGAKIILTLLNQFNIDASYQLEFIKETAKQANIDEPAQEQNILITSKRGRKPKNK